MDQFQGPLIAYTARLTEDLESARDVVQDAFLRLLREGPSARDKLAPWLYTVCRNRAFDIRRKEQRMTPLSEAASQTCESREPAQTTVLEHRESLDQVLQLVGTLPESQQEVVRLKFQSGLSYREIAAITGLSVTHVGVLIHTAIGRLRSQLNQQPTPTSNGRHKAK